MLDRWFRPKEEEAVSGVIRRNAEIKTWRLPIQTFDTPQEVIDNLTRYEREIVGRVRETAVPIARLYNLQDSMPTKPPGVSRTQIENAFSTASKEFPNFTPEHSILVRDETAKLKAIPSQLYWREECKQISDILRSAADAAARGRESDIFLQGYLRALSQAFLRGDFNNAQKVWLDRRDEPKIDVVLGLFDPYRDPLFYTWEGWVGIKDEKATKEAADFAEKFFNWYTGRTGLVVPGVRPRIDNTLFVAGQAEVMGWRANTLPSLESLRDQIGSKVTIFKPRFEDQFVDELFAFRAMVNPNKRMGVTDGQVETASYRLLLAHEFSHGTVIPADARKRLRKYAQTTKELYCDLLSLVAISELPSLNNDPRLDRREREIALALYITNGSLEYAKYRLEEKREEYYIASSAVTGRLQVAGLQIEEGLVNWEDSEKLWKKSREFLLEVEDLLKAGTEKDAEDFYAKNFYPYKEVYLPSFYKEAKIPDFLRKIRARAEKQTNLRPVEN